MHMTTTSPWIPLPPLLLAAALLGGCPDGSGSSGDDASNEPCVPGQSIGCDCDDGSPGSRTCEADGVGYGPCTCSGDDGPSTGSDPTGGPDPTTSTTTTTSSDETGPPPGDSTDTVGGVPDFQQDIIPLFDQACGSGNTACHARNAYFANVEEGCRGWLTLENEALGSVFDDLDPGTMMPSEGPTGCPDMPLHDRLLQLAPWECDASSSYVKPGSLAESYIYTKLTDGQSCGDFRVMPPPGEGYEITDEQVQVLEAWILAGAPQ